MKKYKVTYLSIYGFWVTVPMEAMNSTSAGNKVRQIAKDWKKRIKVELA